MQELKFGVLAYGTIFTFNGKQWLKNGGSTWSPVGARITENDYLGPKNPTCNISKASPKLGGQFQDAAATYFNHDTIVNVE